MISLSGYTLYTIHCTVHPVLRVTSAGGGLHQVCVGADQQCPPVTLEIQNFVTYEYIQKQEGVLEILERENEEGS